MKNEYRCPLVAHRYITNFLQTAVFETQEHFRTTTMSGRINEWLKYGFSINDNPCRKEFLERMLAQPATCPDLSGCVGGEPFTWGKETIPMELYLPHGNVNVDRSGFWNIPTSLVSWYVTWLDCEQDCPDVQMELWTPGGATVWINGVQAFSFRPFTRNMVKHTAFTTALHQGRNMVCVCLEDLAERDTDYYFRLAVPKHVQLKSVVPMRDGVDVERMHHAVEILDNAFVHLDQTQEGWIHLDVENTTSQPFPLQCAVEAMDIASIQNKGGSAQHKVYTLLPGEREIRIPVEEELPPGYYAIRLSTDFCGMTVTRRVAAELTRKKHTEPGELPFEQRREKLMAFAANSSPRNSYRAVAILAQGGDAAAAEALLRRDLPGIRAHKDCCDFYLIAQLYVLMKFRARLTGRFVADLEEAIFTFRFWIDEPGNDVMWFFSENHALLFHACQYLSGRMYPEKLFTASGLTGRQAEQKAEKLLNEWFDDFDKEFMTEWNSNAYLPIDALAFGYLYLMTEPNEPMRQRVRKALDRIFLCLALHGHKNSYASSYGRSYEKQLKGNLTNGPASLLYWAYGKGMITSDTGAFVPLCLSDYRAPEAYARFLMLEDGEIVWEGHNQGFESHVNLTLYKTNRVMLSTANAFKPYLPGYQEHITQATIDPHTQMFVNHPGEMHPFGSGRPGYWAGNGTLPLAMQWKDTVILRYKIPDSSLVNYTHLYFPWDAFDKTLSGQHWCCGEKGGAYLYAWAANGLVRQSKGPYQREEMISPGRRNVWLLRVGDVSGYATIEDFAKACTCAIKTETEDCVSLSMAQEGGFTLCDEPASLTVRNELHLSDLRGERAFLLLNDKKMEVAE